MGPPAFGCAVFDNNVLLITHDNNNLLALAGDHESVPRMNAGTPVCCEINVLIITHEDYTCPACAWARSELGVL